MLKYLFFLFFLFFSFSSHAEVFPFEGRCLNYRIVGFSFPEDAHAISYQLEIAKGRCDVEDIFSNSKVLQLVSKTNKVIGEVPDFGTEYTWRVVYKYNNSKVLKGVWHHFSTGIARNADTNVIRLVIKKQAIKYKDAYVFMGKNGVLYNLKGKPVWYLPQLPGVPVENVATRDIKVTSRGTITFISGTSIYEISYNGELLWQGPDNGVVSGGAEEYYHHEFTKLSSGHYMVLGNEILLGKESKDSSRMAEIVDKDVVRIPGEKYSSQTFATLIEYNEKGQVIWSWKSSDYYRLAELHKHLRKIKPELCDLHENSFFFSERTHYVYLGIKNTNQIYKISYPKGTVERVYGTTETNDASALFCIHHAVKLSQDGNVYLFNNNACLPSIPGIVVMQEPVMGNKLKKVWDYRLPKEQLVTVDAAKPPGAGGNVVELERNDMFVSMCDPYSNIFIVSKTQQLLWSAILETKVANTGKWKPETQYRASVIKDKATFSKMLWYGL